MIQDLDRSEQDTICHTQVCIVGAGTAGIFLTRQLRRAGIEVVLIEAGSTQAKRPDELAQHCEQRGIRYRGADIGRCFGLGGTSTMWGGQMLSLSELDLEARPKAGFEAWPLTYREIGAFLPIVRAELGLRTLSNDGEGLANPLAHRFSELRKISEDFDLRLSEWVPFKNRNFAKRFANTLVHDRGVTVWINATATKLTRSLLPSDSRIVEVKAQSPNGRILRVRPSYVVICGGALESARLLLEFDEETNASITARGAPLGRFFSDHLSRSCGRLQCHDWRRYNQAVAPVFERGTMRTPRLEFGAAAQRKWGTQSAFIHFTFVTRGETGFDVLRSVLRSRQSGFAKLDVSEINIRGVLSDVAVLALWRVFYRRLWIPRRSDLFMQVDIEQTPNASSRVYLSSQRDQMNRKRLVIEWKIAQQDLDSMKLVAELAAKAWRRSALDSVASLKAMLPEDQVSFESLHDVYHPTGFVRMGRDATSSVVDSNLRLWAAENCYVATTAVFPSAGSANPGLTHLALVARLAQHIAHRAA